MAVESGHCQWHCCYNAVLLYKKMFEPPESMATSVELNMDRLWAPVASGVAESVFRWSFGGLIDTVTGMLSNSENFSGR